MKRVTAAVLATTLSCVSVERSAAAADVEHVETCGAMMLVSNDFARRPGVKAIGDFLVARAGELRGRSYTSAEIARLKNTVTVDMWGRINAGEDLTEWSEKTGFSCTLLAWAEGYQDEQQRRNNEALAEQLGKMPGVSRW